MKSPLSSSVLSILSLFLVLVHSEEPPPDTYRTNQGPLTTQFEAPSSCFTEVNTRVILDWPQLEVGCEGPGGNECCPSGWGWQRFFSPGVCPSGHKTCTLPSSTQRQETTNLCCPELFDCPTRVDGKCTSWLNTPVHETVTVDGATETRRISVVYATNIQIRYQASDSSVVPVPTETNLPPIGGWPLSTGQKAGIAIAVIVGVFGIAGAVYYVIRKNKARRAYSDIHLQPNVDPSDPPPAYPGKQ